MDLIDIKCKNCGANLKVSPDSDVITCLQCQSTFNLREQQSTNIANPFLAMENNLNNNQNNNMMPNMVPNNGNMFQNNNMNQNNMFQGNTQPANMQPNNIFQNNNPQPSNNIIPNVPPIPQTNSIIEQKPMEEQPKEPIPVQNNNNNEPKKEVPKKKTSKNNNKKKFLYIFFVLLIVASAIVYYIDYQNRQNDPEIYDPLPSEIQTDDKDKVNVQVGTKTLKLAPDVDLQHEREYYHNNDIVGRLEIPELFNVLVTRGTDNSYYLSHSVSKDYDIRGTEFLDYRTGPTAKQINIYGHNTRDINIKVAFLKLEKFLKKDFFDENEYIVFQHDGGKNFYKIIAIKEIHQENNEHMAVNKTGADFVSHVQAMTTGEGVYNSRSIAYDENSEIIILQTCSHHWDNGFYIVVGVKI